MNPNSQIDINTLQPAKEFLHVWIPVFGSGSYFIVETGKIGCLNTTQDKVKIFVTIVFISRLFLRAHILSFVVKYFKSFKIK